VSDTTGIPKELRLTASDDLTDATDSEIDGAHMASASTAPALTDPFAPSLEATWEAAPTVSHQPTAPLARALEARWAAVDQRQEGAPAADAATSDPVETTTVPDDPSRGEGSEPGLADVGAPHGAPRRFGKPKAPSTVPGPYPSLEDARACGLFV
jgi:hypothetical protein